MAVIALRNPPADATMGRLRGRAATLARSASLVVERVILTVARWQERQHERNTILGLSDGCLKDLGLSRADLEREIRRL